MQFHVPSLDSSETADRLKATLLTSEPNATVDIDVEQKTSTVESDASPDTFRQLITAAGHRAET